MSGTGRLAAGSGHTNATTTLITLSLAAGIALAAPATMHAEVAKPAARAANAAAPKPLKTGRVEANGIAYYYEVHGKGEPLLLLHGGLGSIQMFGPVLARLAAIRQVIAVDLQGHGRTPLGDRPIRLPDMGDDVAVVLQQLGFKRVDVMGYSMGGGVAFRLAVQHAELVRRLVLVSAGYAQDGFHPEMLPMQAQLGAGTADAMKGTPMYESYMAVAPNPADFPRLLDRMGEWMRTPYDWSDDVKKLSMPVMLVFGDSDMFRPEHVVGFYKLLGGGLKDAGWQRESMPKNRLAILPNLTHYEIFLAPELVAAVLPFLQGGTSARSWSDEVKRR